MNRRSFLAGLFASAATGLVLKPDQAGAQQAVECYDAAGNRVPCPVYGAPLPRGVVRRGVRRRVRRKVRRRVRRGVRKAIRRKWR